MIVQIVRPWLPRRVPHPSGLRVRVLTFSAQLSNVHFPPAIAGASVWHLLARNEKFVILSGAKDLNSNFKPRRVGGGRIPCQEYLQNPSTLKRPSPTRHRPLHRNRH